MCTRKPWSCTCADCADKMAHRWDGRWPNPSRVILRHMEHIEPTLLELRDSESIAVG